MIGASWPVVTRPDVVGLSRLLPKAGSNCENADRRRITELRNPAIAETARNVQTAFRLNREGRTR